MRKKRCLIVKLALALAMAVSAGNVLAAKVDPFEFSGIPAGVDQQNAWDYLMKFKLWGTAGITSGRLTMPDSSGWTGTATGSFVAFNSGTELGGPIYIGGDVDLRNNAMDTKFTTGPIRVGGDFYGNIRNTFHAPVCVHGIANNVTGVVGGSLLEGASATTGECSTDKVFPIRSEISIPKLQSANNSTQKLVIRDSAYIKVPSDSKDVYDIYMDYIEFYNDSKLRIRMPEGGRLTRIFLKSLIFGTHPNIQVEVPDGAGYKTLSNSEYAGNLLFYVEDDVKFKETDGTPIQGTFISTKTIEMEKNMLFAGQVIGQNLKMGNEIDGKSFKYVPFDPPKLNIVTTGGSFKENDQWVEVPIKLDSAAKVDVSFKYCYQFAPYVSDNVADASDFNIDGIHPFPICTMSDESAGIVDTAKTKFESVKILLGSTTPTPETKVWLNLKLDGKVEEKESFRLIVFDMVGAVTSDNKRQSYYTLYAEDANVEPTSANVTLNAVEDEAYTLKPDLFTFESKYYDQYGIVITSLPEKGTLSVGGKIVTKLPKEGLVVKIDTVVTSDTEVESVTRILFHESVVYQGAENGCSSNNKFCGNSDVYTNFKFKVVDVNNYVSKDEYTITVSVEPRNDKPEVDNPTISFKENSAAGTTGSTTITVKDVDDENFVYAFDYLDPNIERVNALYSIDSITGVISVKSGAVLNHESTDSSITVVVLVTDRAETTAGKGTKTATSRVTLKIEDVNEKPNLKEYAFSIDENVGKGTKVGEVVATDKDLWTVFTYTLLDSTKGVTNLFRIDTIDGKGVISVVKDNSLNYEVDSVYYVKVVVTDNGKDYGFDNLSDTALVTIKITDVNEKPVYGEVKDSYFVTESTLEHPVKKNTVVGRIEVFDPDAADLGNLISSLVDNDKSAGVISAEDLFAVNIVQNSADNKWYVNVVVVDSAKLDYEALYSKHFDEELGKVAFDVTIKVSDKGGLAVSASTKLVVEDVNEAPSITPIEKDIEENLPNGTVVAEAIASDIDTCNSAFSHLDYKVITRGVPFVMDSNKIKVSDYTALDYEKTPVFVFDVEVKNCLLNSSTKAYTENCLADTASVKFTLTNVNENPVISCRIGDTKCNGPFDAIENSAKDSVIHTFAISDVDTNDVGKLSVILADKNNTTGITAEDLFDVKISSDNTEFSIVVKDSSLLDYENLKETYDVILKVVDEKGLTDTIVRTIKIVDVNEKPELDPVEETVEENLKKGTVVATMNAKDLDDKNPAFRHFEYSVIEKDVPFVMDSNKVKVSDSSQLDFETNPSFTFNVMVENCVKNDITGKYTDHCLADTAEVTINLSNVNEKPEIACVANDDNCNGPYAVKENSDKETPVHSFAISDVDTNDMGYLTVELTDDNKVSGQISAEDLFAVNLDSTGTIATVVVKNQVLLDYENIAHSFNVTLTVKDGDGLTATLTRTINIEDVNEKPSISDDELKIEENKPNGTVVGTLVASDPDTLNPKFSTLSYSIIETNTPFKMDSNKVMVANSSLLNYEKDSVFTLHVRVTDGSLADTATVVVKLTDKEEKPEIIVVPDPDCDENDLDCHRCDATIKDCDNPEKPDSSCTENCGSQDSKGNIVVTVKENSPEGTIVLEYLVRDEDKDDVANLIPEFVSTNNSGADSLFKIDLVPAGDGEYKIVLTVANDTVLDYEKVREEHKLVISVTDPAGLTDTIVRTVKVIDVNEPPIIAQQEFHFDEHNEAGAVVGKIIWGDDWDTKDASFRDNRVVQVNGENDKFAIDSIGYITAKVSFNYETDPTVYEIYVKVEDHNDPSLFVLDTMYIFVDDVPEKPHITSTEFTIPENPGNKAVVGTITSEDKDDLENKEERTYTLVDSSAYVTVTPDGKILVKDSTKFDFEKVEKITIKVKVSDPQKMSSDTTIVIKITDVNEKPNVDDQTIHVSEDTKIGSVLDTIVASDPDTKSKEFGKISYEAIGGDTAVFKVDSKTGEVILKDSLDYEKKTEYKLTVEVSDGTYTDTATITVKVDNVIEKSVVEITKVTDDVHVWEKPDSVFTNLSDITICWNEGREVCEKSKCIVQSKEVCQDTTLKEGVHTIVKEFKDPTTDAPGRDTVVVFISTASPIVTVSANTDSLGDVNIYTIEEKLDEKDSNIYVKDSKNEIRVTVKDPVTRTDSSFVVKLNLDTLKVSTKDLDVVSSSVEKGNITLNLNPTSGVTRTPLNGTEVKVTYTEKVGDKTVTVTYLTDNDGEIIKKAVLDEKGKVDSIEVISVSYETTIGGKTVSVSYQADALTGQALNVSSDGRLTTADKIVIASADKPSSSSSSGKPSSSSSEGTVLNVGAYIITYDYVDDKGNSVMVTYTIDEKGNIVKNEEGDIGYSVSYTYVNKFGNSAMESVFIVLDQIGPKVEILSPTHLQVVRANYVEVVWTVDGVVQDTLTLQGLEKGLNKILRYYRDKAGNESMDSVYVIMKDGKDVELAVEQPVVEMNQDKVDEYYDVNPPEEGERFAISIKNPTSGKEVETLIAGTFGTKDGSGDAPYPGFEEESHLGPTLVMDVRLPVVNDIGGLATLDDLVGSDGLVSLDGVDAKNSKKVSVDEYVDSYCKDDFKKDGDLSRINLYKTRMDVHVWIYTTLGNFVDYYSFKQDLNNPDYTNDAGLLQMYMELKPTRDGEVLTEDGHVMATGAYLYKVEAKIRAELQCTLPPVASKTKTVKKKGDIIKKSDEMLKSFGYKRPSKK